MRARVPLCVCRRACLQVIHSCGTPTDGGRRHSQRLTAPRRLIGFDFIRSQRNPCGDGTICCLDSSDEFSTFFFKCDLEKRKENFSCKDVDYKHLIGLLSFRQQNNIQSVLFCFLVANRFNDE